MGKQGNYINANGIDIYYETYGDGPPLILLHGAYGFIKVQWKDHIPAYAKHFRVYALDARAHGRTRNPGGTLTNASLLQDLLEFIEVLKIDQPFVSGWSMGAGTVLNMAIKHPDLAKAFVIGGISHKLPDEAERNQNNRDMGMLGPGEIDWDVYKEKFPLYDLIKAEMGENFESLVTSISHLRYDTPPEFTDDEFKQVTTPILLMLGDRDNFTELENIIELYRLLPNSELAVIPGADHSMCRTKPELFSQLALDFLLRHSEENK